MTASMEMICWKGGYWENRREGQKVLWRFKLITAGSRDPLALFRCGKLVILCSYLYHGISAIST